MTCIATRLRAGRSWVQTSATTTDFSVLRFVQTDCVVLAAFYSMGKKGKALPQQAEVVQGGPGRLRPRIFLTSCTTRVVGLQPYAPATFTSGEIPGTQGNSFRSGPAR